MTELPLRAGAPGPGLARLPIEVLTRLGLSPGDVVELASPSTATLVRVLPAPRGSGVVEVAAETVARLGQGPVRIAPKTLPPLRSPAAGPVLRETLYDQPLTLGQTIAGAEVLALDPAPAGLFTETTTLSLETPPETAPRYEGIGGMADQIARVHELVATPLMRPDLFERLGIAPPRGLLFVGPPGSGKTLLARAVAARTSAAFFQISGPEIVSKHYGESEAALRNLFAAAAKSAPAIVFIDEIDAIAPRRDTLSGEKQVERRLVAQLLTLMDGLSDRGRIIVMAATNLPDSLDPALRRPGRFDRELRFGPPDAAQREKILAVYLVRAPLAADVDLAAIAAEAHGYVGADLAALAREASMAALNRAIRAAGGEANLAAADLLLTQADLAAGLAATAPSALRDTEVESPPVTFADIGGLESVKAALTEAVLWPQRHREAFAALRLRPASGVLLAGPPGAGKTLLARALAQESGMNFIVLRPARVLSQFLGEAERAVAEIFAKARHAAPCLIFLDEIDTLAPRRSGRDGVVDRIVAQLLTEMDGMTPNSGITVLAATNRPAAIDPALTRPGRFDLVIELPLPDPAARAAILALHLKGLPHAAIDLAGLAEATEGASGADLAALAEGAARAALRRCLAAGIPPALGPEDLSMALATHRARAAALAGDHLERQGHGRT